MLNHNSSLPAFILAMLKPEFYLHPVKTCQLIETHISWVILTGEFVYKIKKPVNLGFVDFTTLEKRKFYCEEELRLNRRLAPDLYLELISITGDPDCPQLMGDTKIFEYAVKMKQFPQDTQLDQLLAKNKLSAKIIDSLADLISDFHKKIETSDINSDYGKPEYVYQPAKENFTQIQQHIKDKTKIDLLSKIEQWTENEFNKLKNIFNIRKQNGFIRECHGDLHLRNLAWYDDKPLAFDCLEFNPNFRWIDVVNEIAFLIMDLDHHSQEALAQRFLNRYLELTGDYAGCTVLRFYLVYRAMVRAKVDAIRANQTRVSPQESEDITKELSSYLKLALKYTQSTKPFIIITRGMSASGKSTYTQILLEKLGAIRIRSDVERKRLFNIKANQYSTDGLEQGIYTKEATKKTYSKLLALCEMVIDAGYPVIIDATFSSNEQRAPFCELAAQKQIRYIILELTASNNVLKQRILARKGDVSDADITVLENQINSWKTLNKNEEHHSIQINTEKPFELDKLLDRLNLK